MNGTVSRIFKDKVLNPQKLTDYGFTLSDGRYRYSAPITGGFVISVDIGGGDINTLVTDTDTGEPYTLFLVDGAEGSFVGMVRAEYERVLCDIADKCFDGGAFKSGIFDEAIEYVRAVYGDELEFLWKNSDAAIWRRKDNRKWYAVFLTVSGGKFGRADEKIEILDLRFDPAEIQKAVDNVKIFGGYHMNKKRWVTVLSDGSIGFDEVRKMIDESYILAGGKR